MAKAKSNDVWIPMDYEKWCKLRSTKQAVKKLKQDLKEYDDELKYGKQLEKLNDKNDA